jgi:hypothetical protein
VGVLVGGSRDDLLATSEQQTDVRRDLGGMSVGDLAPHIPIRSDATEGACMFMVTTRF